MKSTITKKDVAKRTAKIVDEKIYLTEKIVDGVFTALREFMEAANPEAGSTKSPKSKPQGNPNFKKAYTPRGGE